MPVKCTKNTSSEGLLPELVWINFSCPCSLSLSKGILSKKEMVASGISPPTLRSLHQNRNGKVFWPSIQGNHVTWVDIEPLPFDAKPLMEVPVIYHCKVRTRVPQSSRPAPVFEGRCGICNPSRLISRSAIEVDLLSCGTAVKTSSFNPTVSCGKASGMPVWVGPRSFGP